MKAKGAVTAQPIANVFEAFRDVVYRYGVAEMAAEIGMVPGTLYNKTEAQADSRHQPTLRDVLLVTRISGDMAVVDALNQVFHRAAFDITPGQPVSDAALMELLCRVGSENGQMHNALAQGLADGHFSPADFAAVRQEAHELIAAVLCFVQRLEGLVDA